MLYHTGYVILYWPTEFPILLFAELNIYFLSFDKNIVFKL